MKTSYLFKQAWRGVARHRGGFVLATTVIGVCITLLSAFLVVTVNVLALVRVAAERGEMYAFVTDNVATEPGSLLAQVASLEGIRSVRFVSREEALQELRADLGPDADLVDVLADNPLPASIRLTVSADATSETELENLERKLLLLPGVSEVWSGKETLVRLNRALRTATILDLILALLVAVSVVFIVFQTVETSISTRRREIEVMELVGASPVTVRMPFLLEGLLQGFGGGTAAFAATVVVYLIVKSIIPAPALPVLFLLIVDIVIGVALGLIGASMALGRRDARISRHGAGEQRRRSA